MKIKPHILYPAIVVFILIGSIMANVILIIKASSDQGPQIIKDYYVKAANYNEEIDEREESARLGWSTKIVTYPPKTPKSRQIDFIVLDANKAPLKGASGEVELYNPAKADVLGKAVLKPVNDGLYTAVIEGDHLNRHGLYDIVLHINHDGSHYTQKSREMM